MLKKFFFASAVVCMALSMQAQVTEVTKDMSYGNRPGYEVVVKNADVKAVTSQWEDYLKKTYGAKTKKGKGGELVSTGASGGPLGSTPGTIYSKVEKSGTDVVINAWFDNGSSFVNTSTNPTAGAAATASLATFQTDARRGAVSSELATNEKELKKITDDLEKTRKDTDNLRKDIESYKKKISEAEQSILKNERAQETLFVEQQKQQLKVDETRVRLQNVANEKN
jgi:cob(I)alamin adenosyltransferase